MARTTLGAGLGLRDRPSCRFDLGGGVVLERTATVTELQPEPRSTSAARRRHARPRVGPRARPTRSSRWPGADNQVESPFNAGTYEQGYVLFSLGATYTF